MPPMLPAYAFFLNRQHQQPRVTADSLMARFKFEDSNLGHIVDEIEEETGEEFENEISESILDHRFDEEIMEEEEEEIVNDVPELILDAEIIEEEEEEEVDTSETRMESGNHESVETGMEYDIYLLNQQQGLNQTSGRLSRTARMRVNTNYIRYRVQVPQLNLDEIENEEEEEEEEEEEVVEEDDVIEFTDEDMSECFETRTHYGMDVDGDEEEEACAICLLEYQDEHTIATLQCGHEFHAECINKWLQRKRACPFCRASVLPKGSLQF